MALNLIVRGGADFSGMQREMARVQRSMSNFQSSVSNTMKNIGLALATLGVGKLIKDSTQMAMSVEASLQQIQRIMGESTNQFLKWANTQAIAFNMSKSEAIKYGAVFGNLVSGFSKDAAETTKNTQDLLKASAVVASATGRTMEDTLERIRSGLLGNTESIEDLGINVNVAMIESTEAFKKFAGDKSWQQLDFQTQQQIRLMAILEQANKKYGDTVANNTSSSMAQLVAQLKNVQLNLGNAFMPILNVILPVLSALASKLVYITSIIAQFSQALFGNAQEKQAKSQSNAVSNQANAMSDLGDATKKAGKEAKGALAGFDEINSLSNNSNSEAVDTTGGAGLGADAPPSPINFNTNAPEISAKVQAMANNLKSKIKEITDFIAANKEIIIAVFAGIAAALVTLNIGEIIVGITAAFEGLVGVFGILLTPLGLVAATIGVLVGSFVYLYQTNEQFRNDINTIWSDISKIFQDFWNNTLQPIGKYIINDFIGPVMNAFKNNILPVLADIFVGASKIFGDILNLVISTINNIWGVLRPGMDLIKTIIVDVLQIIKDLWDKYGQDLIANIRNFIKGAQDTFQLIWDNILNPIIKPFLKMLTWLWTEHLSGLITQIGDFIMKCVNGALELYNGFIKPIIEWLIVELGPSISNTVTFIVDVFGTMLAAISDVIKGLFKILGGLIDFIVGVFTGNWKKAWEGVKGVFGGIWDMIVGVLKGSVNIIIDLINSMLRNAVSGLNNFIQNAASLANKLPGVNIQVGYIQAPQIPKLAKGGITNGPMLAMIGDNPGGKEVVSPLDKLQDMIASAVGSAMMAANQFSANNSGKQGDIIIQIDGTTLARVMNPYNEKESSRIGNAMILTT